MSTLSMREMWEHDEDLSALHQRVLSALLIWFAVGESVVCLLVILQSYGDGIATHSLMTAEAAVPVLVGLALVHHRLSLRTAAALFLLHLGVLSAYLQSFHGLTPATALATVACMLLAAMSFGIRGMLLTVVVAVVCIAISGFLVVDGWIEPWGDQLWNPHRVLVWLRYGAVLLFFAGGLASALAYVLESLLETAATLRDTLERERAERTRQEAMRRALERARRLETLAQFAGGLAHDFNNALTLVMARAQLIESEPGASPRVVSLASEIADYIESSAQNVRSLLSLGRRDASVPVEIALRDLVRRSESALRAVLPKTVTLELGGFDDRRIKVDVARLQQALLNLALNARDAMPEGGALAMRVVERTFVEVPAGWRAAPGRYLVIECSDTGIGMDEATLDRLFEPFFTTKAPDRGTGLGLAMVRVTVYDAYGFIEVESTPGAGTTFHICLPRLDAAGRGPGAARG